MKLFRSTLAALVALLVARPAAAERIYIMNAAGYNQADPALIEAIGSLGHTVDVSTLDATSLPIGFTSACNDHVNGYNWLCFFGSADRTALIPEVQMFLAAGGKVLLQYEVSCCTIASQSAAVMASAFTGLTITLNAEAFVALSGEPDLPGWETVQPVGCLHMEGNAYKGMDGIPAANALSPTANLNGSFPDISVCTNFGFVFRPQDLPGQSGGLLGLGDVNLYYLNGGEPPNSGGLQPVDMVALASIFPNPSHECGLLPAGCLSSDVPEDPSDGLATVHPVPADDQLLIEPGNARPMDLFIFDSLGRTIHRGSTQGMERSIVPTAYFAAGTYELLLRSANTQQVVTFTVAH